jgi:hypothetical protein
MDIKDLKSKQKIFNEDMVIFLDKHNLLHCPFDCTVSLLMFLETLMSFYIDKGKEENIKEYNKALAFIEFVNKHLEQLRKEFKTKIMPEE